MKKLLTLFITLVFIFGLTGCSRKEAANVVIVGTVAGPETFLMMAAKRVARKRFGLAVKIIPFTDYITPNVALAQGDIDANAYQHMPFLEAQIKAHGYKFISAGKTFLFPMGLYSKKVKKLSELKAGAQIGIPNDPSNEARALLLLQKAGLIKLKPGITINATPADIASNPKRFKFIELGAPELPRALNDVSLAAINTNFAIPAGLSLDQAVFEEGKGSLYTNLIVVRKGEQNSKKIKELVEAYHSQRVINEAKKVFGSAAIPGWK